MFNINEAKNAEPLIQVNMNIVYSPLPPMPRQEINIEQADMLANYRPPKSAVDEPKPTKRPVKAAKKLTMAERRQQRAERQVPVPAAPQHIQRPVQAQIPPAREVGVVRAEPRLQRAEPARVNEYEIADALPGNSTGLFWNVVKSFHWHNASDGDISADTIAGVFARLAPEQRKAFKHEYAAEYGRIRNILRADGILERNNMRTFAEEARVISHVIALGYDQCITISMDMEILQFLIESGDCMSLNERLGHQFAM